ncbi:hypothetical protein [Hydrogenophaga sp. PBL-H3]|uniref:hypothetical protein n=1 Tax=Hydrogenophaga sp. PBL-H3 TaxID=434010 RepID=UPI0013579956|nr:hypothetical protein [Hydrogenophaga sp. PBL-H3]
MYQVIDAGAIEHEKEPHRLLLLQADTVEELEALISLSKAKGWLEYVEGVATQGPRLGSWMLKPDAPPTSTA